MLGYGWGHWLVVTIGMVLATFVVALGIVTGAVAILMQAYRQAYEQKG